MKYYCINTVAQRTGITESSLRRWEAAGYFTSQRVSMGKAELRIYTDELVDFLQRVKKVIDSGMQTSAAFEFVNGGA